MIKIEIDNAGATPAHELRAVAACLIAIADASADKVDTSTETYVVKTPAQRRAAAAKINDDVKQSIDAQIKAFDAPIAAEDRPDTGAPERMKSMPEIFADMAVIGEALREPAAIDPRVVFGTVPNVPAVPASSSAGAVTSTTVPAVPQVTSTIVASVPKPPVQPVPGAAAQADEGVASDAQFDKTGLPWDARIHSRGRSMNSDGTWRSKRGVDDATVAAVSAELRAVPGVPVAPAPTLADDVATAEASWPFTPPAGLVPTPPVSAAVPPPPVVSFPAFMGKYVPLVTAGKISQSQITEILVSHGIPSLPLLSARTDLLPTIAAQLDALIAA